uniref:FYVE-type domain-containing protein n=1 Tax=Gadus morhua TaxID=8049 RepID=A0A8C5FNT5_GADMO
KPAVAPKPRVRQDRDPREAECCPDQKTCPNGGPRAPDRGKVMDLRERDPGNASPAPDAGGESAERAPEDDTMQGGGEGWRSTDASALRDVRGSPDSPGASHAGLVEHVYEETGPDLGEGPPLERRSVGPGPPPFSRPRLLDPAAPALTSSPMLGPVRARCYPRPPGLSLYPRSVSVEGQELTLRRCQERDAASREPGDDGLFLSHAFGSSGSFSRCPPRPISGLATPTSLLDIPPPFELACITKRPLTKSSPSLHTDGENNKKKSSIKRFLMLKFRKKSSDRKPAADLPSPSSRSSSESINHLTGRSLEAERNALSHFSLVNVCSSGSPRSAARLLPPLASYGEGQRDRRSLAFLSRSVIRVESFEERSRGPLVALALTKPRSISFPSADSASDYENVPPLSSDYENVSVPHPPPLGPETFPEFFERPWRARSTAHDTDGYVDMSSFPGFERRTRAPPEETESAYTEAYKVCSMAVGPPAGLEGLGGAEGPDPGQTSEDEDRGADGNYDRPVCTQPPPVESPSVRQDFREAVCSAVGADGERVLGDERLREILTDLPDVYSLHRRILGELEDRLRHWEESQSIADVILSKKADFFVFTTFIGHYDRSVSLLEDSCRSSPAFAALVSQFEENVLRLVNIEYSVRGQKDLLRPGRMNDVLLYTYPQQDGKYRLKDTLSLSGMKVEPHSLNRTGSNVFLMLTPDLSSSSERDDWFYTLSRTVADHSRGAPASTAGHGEDEDYPGGALGERPPRPVCASQVLMCMNCTCDFSLRLRRHHCHACGRIVCRSCSRNRCALKYLKGRTAKVCDHCYSQLHARGTHSPPRAPGSASSAPTSPRTGRSRPLSAVFQNIHPPNLWRHRKGTEKVASESLPLLGFTVKLADREQLDEANLFQLYHKKTLYYSFRAEDNCTAQR